MVIGSGLLAKAFHQFADDGNVVVFASGVSNSLEQNKSAFEREKNLLLKYLDGSAKLVYFSTVSVHDQSLTKTPYIIFKNEIENLIKEFDADLANPKNKDLFNQIPHQDEFNELNLVELQNNQKVKIIESSSKK